MSLEVDTLTGGRRVSDRQPVTTSTTVQSNDGTMWVVLLSIFFTALIVGGIVYLYQQNVMNGLRADYQLQIERTQNQLRDMQLKQEIQLTGTPAR